MLIVSVDLHVLALSPKNLFYLLGSDGSIDAPPSLWPKKKYCDITGLNVQPM